MTEEPPLYHEDVAGYRQPMVTSIGIIMGFLLAFMANWAVSEEEGRVLQDAADWLVAVTILISISLMVVTLARLLDNRVREDVGRRYHTTYRLYIASMTVGLAGLIAALII
ncbi:hypothetical protein ABC365_05280 [Brevundimonas sp. 3P9-tot-E]|uniref:hypothetical protein n=1 Tax=Brevundimonas TaxID=41275 RepID=UPI000F770A80|nr:MULTISPECIES: hypothetical protein [Brevundimonas]RSB44585.1 hypothetical protein EGK63_10455 [Brevundimonas sp. 357]